MFSRRGFAAMIAAGLTKAAFAQRASVPTRAAPADTVWPNGNEFPEGPPKASVEAMAQAMAAGFDMTVALAAQSGSLSANGKARSTVQGAHVGEEELRKTHAYWPPCNYLGLGTIYLCDNPLLKMPLGPDPNRQSPLSRFNCKVRNVVDWVSTVWESIAVIQLRNGSR
jgi:hypothetical protein